MTENTRLAVAALLHRATRTPNTVEGTAMETKKVFEAFMSNGYPMKVITDVQKRQRKTEMIPELEELVRELFVSVDPPLTSSVYAVVPYKNGLTEPLTRFLQKYDINKPIRTLQQDFSLKDRSMRLM